MGAMASKARGIRWVAGADRERHRAWALVTIVLAATLAMPSLVSAEETREEEKISLIVTSHGGPVQTEPHVYQIYWGKKWGEEPYAAERTTFETLYSDFSGSAWQGILEQYWGAEGYGGSEGFVSKELAVGAPYTDGNEPPAEVTQAKIETEVKEAIKEASSKKLKGWPTSVGATTVNDQFVLLTPSGTISNIHKKACGEHGPSEEANYVWDLIPWEEEKREACRHTYILSHEYAEAATDPRLDGWREWTNEFENFPEIADICQEVGGHGTLDGIEVTKLASNQMKKEGKGGCAESDSKPSQNTPKSITEGTSGVTYSQATLEGTVIPRGLDTSQYGVEWRSSESEKYKKTMEPWYWYQNESRKVSVQISAREELEPDTTYHYRLVMNSVQTVGKFIEVPGELKEFKTPYAPPIVKTGSASKITNIGATLTGTVNPKGSETTYDFEYGPTKSYGSKTPEVEVGSGIGNLEESKAITGLEPGVTYHFRMVATNKGGTGGTEEGNEGTFTTPETEWRQAGGLLSEPIGTKSSGTVKVTDEGYGKWECETTGEGSVGTTVTDEETKWGASKCTVVSGSCEASKGAALKAVHLPWRSELLMSGGSSYDVIASSGKGAPGYTVECTVGGILKVVDECTATTLKTGMANVAGGVDAAFDGEKLNCSIGGTGKGTLEGTMLLEATKGGELEVTAPEWRQGSAKLSASVATKSKGTVKLTDEGHGEWECEATGEGPAGLGAVGEETKWGASKCTVVSGSCEASKGAALKAVHLPWRSELLIPGGASYDMITSSGKGAPGYTIECTVGGILKVVDECTATTLKTYMTDVTGGVDAAFDGEKLYCSMGGTGKGTLEGTMLLEATKGGELEVTAPEWRQGSAKLSASVATKSKGTVKLTDEGHGEWECEATGEGPAGLGAVGEETKWGASKCTVVSGSCEASKGAALKAVHLPWRSELLIPGGASYDMITSSGKGAPGYTIECTVGGILKVVDECTATTLKTYMTDVTGGVDAAFDGEKLYCSMGGTGKGTLEGTMLIEATKGGQLEAT